MLISKLECIPETCEVGLRRQGRGRQHAVRIYPTAFAEDNNVEKQERGDMLRENG